jgi:hypothetical protein
MINEDMKISGLLVECHHASWRDGGVCYSNLRETDDGLTIRSFAQMMLSQEKWIWQMAKVTLRGWNAQCWADGIVAGLKQNARLETCRRRTRHDWFCETPFLMDKL